MTRALLSVAGALCTLLASGAGLGQQVTEVQRLQVLPAYTMRAPTAVWDGARYLVVFESYPGNQPELTDLYMARIDGNGLLETGDVRALGLGGDPVPAIPKAAHHAASGRTMLVWLAKSGPFSDVAVAWLDFDDAPRPTAGLALTQGDDAELRPTIGANDHGFMVGWATVGLGGGSVVSGQRFEADGTAIDPSPERLRESHSTFENRPFVRGAGDRFFFAWDEADVEDVDGFITTVTSSGAFRAQTPVRIAQGNLRQSGLTVSPLGERHYAVWQDFSRGLIPDAWGVRLQDDLQTDREPAIVTQVDGRTNEPVVTGDENGALVVWQSLREGRTRGEIRAGRIDTAGRVLEPAGFEVISVDDNVFEIAVAKGPGDQYLVVAIEDTVAPRIVYALVNSELAAVPEPPPDAGLPPADTGVTRIDAGPRDAGVADTGPTDSGGAVDSGMRPPVARDEGCRTLPGELSALLLLGGLAFAARRRRRG